MPGTTNREELVRAAYRAYETGDREFYDNHLTTDFVFFSPADRGLDRDGYFERCWPNADNLEHFEFVRLFESGDEVIVTYEATRVDGSQFRNTEVLGFDGDKLARVEVYFGWELK
jgi:ketosteroid isomerase-like protein